MCLFILLFGELLFYSSIRTMRVITLVSCGIFFGGGFLNFMLHPNEHQNLCNLTQLNNKNILKWDSASQHLTSSNVHLQYLVQDPLCMTIIS